MLSDTFGLPLDIALGIGDGALTVNHSVHNRSLNFICAECGAELAVIFEHELVNDVYALQEQLVTRLRPCVLAHSCFNLRVKRLKQLRDSCKVRKIRMTKLRGKS